MICKFFKGETTPAEDSTFLIASPTDEYEGTTGNTLYSITCLLAEWKHKLLLTLKTNESRCTFIYENVVA